jgi:hypothetical protein
MTDFESMQSRFETILAEAIGLCMDAGIPPAAMIVPLTKELEELRKMVPMSQRLR